MRTKNNNICLSILILLFCLIAICITIFVNKGFGTYADISKPYKVIFDYEYHNGDTIITECNVFKTKLLTYDGFSESEIEIQLYGDKYLSEISYLDDDDYLASTSITFFITSKFKNHKLEVKKNDMYSVIDTTLNKSCILDNLTSGSYYLEYFGFNEVQDENGDKNKISISIKCKINIDIDAPVFKGTSLTVTELFANDSFCVSVSDSASGVKGFYWRTPNDSAYSLNPTNEKVFSDNIINGIYRFYAIDNCGNRTQTNYVFYDNIAPYIIINCDGNEYQSSCTIDKEFNVVSVDSGSGLCEIQYKSSYLLEWQKYNEGTPIESQGCYDFKVTDKAGNISLITVNFVQNLYSHTHDYYAEIVEPTCICKGYTVYTCIECDDTYIDNYILPIGHKYELTYMMATCTDYGKTVYTCQVCGHEYWESDGTFPKGHNYTNAIITAPTCTTEGLRRCICDDCGDSYETIIPANGHNYKITDSTSSGGKTTRTYTCTDCGHTYKQELGDQYEEVSNYVEYLFQQYSPYMWWVFLAAAGVWSIIIGVMIAIAQKNEEKEKSKKMLVNYVIGLVVIAIILVAFRS